MAKPILVVPPGTLKGKSLADARRDYIVIETLQAVRVVDSEPFTPSNALAWCLCDALCQFKGDESVASVRAALVKNLTKCLPRPEGVQ